MLMLVSSVAIAWLVSDLVGQREASSSTRRTLLLAALALCVTAKQCEALLAWLLDVPYSAFRLNLRIGPVLGSVVVLCVFLSTGFARVRWRRPGMTARAYIEHVWASICYVAPAFALVLIFASTASLFIFATIERLFELLSVSHVRLHLEEWRRFGALYILMSTLYLDVQRRCLGAASPLLPSNLRAHGSRCRRIDANGDIREH
mmetsp:Transcript_426/g.1147  ORF Transcript_426/g.1147 Transcript_426/m.1147 type:complete len:204 (+) Transcript_426:79-690(+)